MRSIKGIKIDINLAGMKVNRCPQCSIIYSCRAALTKARLSIPDPRAEVEKLLKPGAPVSIKFGFRGGEPGIFKGKITGYGPGEVNRDELAVYASGPELPILENSISESWYEEPASVIAKRIISQSGLIPEIIELPDLVIPRMTLSGVNTREGIMQLMHTLETGFNLNFGSTRLEMKNKSLCLTQQKRKGPKFIIETGGGIITNRTLNKGGSSKVVETFLLPGILPGQEIIINDKKKGINSTFSVDEVTHSFRSQEIRTFISYGGKYDRFRC